MKILTGALLVIFGLLTLATPAMLLGAGLIALGGWMLSTITPRQEECFMGVMVILGALGALMIYLQFAWQRLTAWLH